MLFDAETVNAAGKAYLLAFNAALAGAAPQSDPYYMRVEGSGSGAAVVIPEGMGSLWEWKGRDDSRTPVQFVTELKNRDFELNIKIPRSAYLDDQLGQYTLQFQAAAAAARMQPDRMMADLLVRAFSKKGPDGAVFISAAHKTASGTASNLQAGALSDSTFNQAYAKLLGMADYYGEPLRMAGTGARLRLIVGPSLRKVAREIAYAQLGSGGATNINAGDAEVDVLPELVGSYASYWFVAYANGPVRPFIHLVRQDTMLHVPDINGEEVVRTKEVVHRVERRGDAGYGVWQTIVGSNGT
jgi:phage major head subunit gpT-like protein